jgi:DNA-binding CsgD family transcriptional regulator
MVNISLDAVRVPDGLAGLGPPTDGHGGYAPGDLARVRTRNGRVVLDRVHESQELTELLRSAAEGRPGVALIEGSIGVGRSTLLRCCADTASRMGMRVLSARCGELERDLTLGVVRQLFEGELAAVGTEEQRRRWLASATVTADGAELSEEYLATADASARAGQDAALHELYRFTAHRAGEIPTLITVDDVHWADEQSVRWLAYLIRRLSSAPLAIVLTAHAVPPRANSPFLNDITTAPPLRRIMLSPLPKSGVVHFVRNALGRSAARRIGRDCLRATGGNPLLLSALLRDLAQPRVGVRESGGLAHVAGPEFVDCVTRILRRYPEPSRALAEALAVLDSASLKRAADLAEVDLPTARWAFGYLDRARLVHSGTQVSFAHPLLRDGVHAGMAGSRRAELHSRAAQTLYDDNAPIEQVASHLLQNVPAGSPWTVDVLRMAAQRANRRGANNTAQAYLLRSLREPPTPHQHGSILAELGMIEASRDPDAGVSHMKTALMKLTSPQLRAEVVPVLVDTLRRAGRNADAAEVLDREIEMPRSTSPAHLDYPMKLRILRASIAAEESPRPALLAQELVALKAQVEPGTTQWRALCALQAFIKAGDASSAGEAAELALATIAGDLPRGPMMRTIGMAAFVLLWAGYADEADRFWKRSYVVAQQRHVPLMLALSSVGRATTSLRLGRLDEVITYGRAATELLLTRDRGTLLPLAVASLMRALVEQGRLDEAEQLTRIRFTDGARDSWQWPHFLAARARLLLAHGNSKGALADLRDCGHRLTCINQDSPAVIPWRSEAALIHLALGERREAIPLVGEELKLARMAGASRTLGVSLRGGGLVIGGAAGNTMLRDAVNHLERSGDALEYARSLVDYGLAQQASGDEQTGRKLLHRGLELARSCQATPLADQAHRLLRKLGGRSRHSAAVGEAALTASEHRVASLAVQGFSNREIAERLFITRRTVENHLTSAFRKLGIVCREQLAAVLTNVADT